MQGGGGPGAAPATIRPYFEALLLLLLASGFLTLAATGRLGWVWIGLGAGAMLLRGGLLARGVRPQVPARWLNLATLLYILFFAADLLLLGSSFIAASVHLVIFVAIFKLFSAERSRDYLYLCVLAFLEVLAATTLTVAAGFLIFFALFLLLLVATFVAYEMMRGEQAGGERARVGQHFSTRRVRRGLAGISLAMALAIGILGASLFFLLPRLSFQYWNPLMAHNAISGFSNEVALGEVRNLQQSDQVVMHIRLLGPRADSAAELASARSILWRGRALNRFQGDRWLDTARPFVASTSFGRLSFPARQYPGKPVQLMQYRVMMEPLGTGVLFLAPGVRAVLSPLKYLVVDSGQTIAPMSLNLDTGTGGLAYTAISDLGRPPAAVLRRAGRRYPARIRRRYLQLPPALDPQIPSLARRITARGPADAWDRIQALRHYLRSHYRYTLRGLPAGRDPLANFLFSSRAGDCEYFASALAILGRTLGIPTRVVTGFATGPYNRLSQEFLIRGRDAHAWVEAYFPQPSRFAANPGLWIPLDATPPSSAPAFTGAWGRMQLLLDAAQTFWQDWIINYDFSHQVRLALQLRHQWSSRREVLFGSLRNWAGAWRRRLAAWWRHPSRGRSLHLLWLPGWLALALALGYAVHLFRRRYPVRGGGARPAWERRQATAYYRRLQTLLRRAGYARTPALTASELAGLVRGARLQPAVTGFVHDYEAVRFGHDPSRLAALPRQLHEIHRLLRNPARV